MSDPVLVTKTPPDYPENARRRRIQGVVVVEAVITSEGKIRDVNVVQSPDELLTVSVISAMKQWRYSPALCDGKPIDVRFRDTVSFALNPPGMRVPYHSGERREPDPTADPVTDAPADAAADTVDTTLERNGVHR